MSQENVEIVRAAYEAFNRHDFDAVLEAVEPDVEWFPAIAPLLGVGPIRGKQALETFLAVDIGEGFTEFSATPAGFEDLGEAVLVQAHYETEGRASGASISQETFSLFTFRGDRIASFHDYGTKAEALEAAGPRG